MVVLSGCKGEFKLKSAESEIRKSYKNCVRYFLEWAEQTHGFPLRVKTAPKFAWFPGDGWYVIAPDGTMQRLGPTKVEAMDHYNKLAQKYRNMASQSG